MKRSRVTQRDILFLSISMFVMITVWIIFNLYHTWATSTISSDLQIQITPIDPNFDTDTIHALEGKDTIVPLFEPTSSEPEASISAVALPSPTATPLVEPSIPTPSISPTEEPTPEL